MLKKHVNRSATFSLEILYRTMSVRFVLNGLRIGDFCLIDKQNALKAHESAITTILKATTDWEFNANVKAVCAAAKGNTADHSNHLHEVGKIRKEERWVSYRIAAW